MKNFFFAMLMMSLSLSSTPAFSQRTCTVNVVPERELLITDVSVVNDRRATSPDGAWSFTHMMRNLNISRMDLSDFTQKWLEEWLTDQNVNGFTVPARAAMGGLINAWPKNQSGKLDMNRAPFRLLAIVNRIDLTTGHSGEGRFVYGVMNGQGRPTQFTVIFEFMLPNPPGGSGQVPLVSWAKRWHQLGRLSFGESFNQNLEDITRTFVKPGGISQVRTNEIALASPWQMREFDIGLDGLLVSTTTKQSPDEKFLNSRDLSAWIRMNAQPIIDGVHVVPSRTLGGHGHAPVNWAPDLVNDRDQRIRDARQNFAIQTCTGCHSNETNTRFLHISPRAQGPATISTFLQADLAVRKTNMETILCLPPSQARAYLKTRTSTRVH